MRPLFHMGSTYKGGDWIGWMSHTRERQHTQSSTLERQGDYVHAAEELERATSLSEGTIKTDDDFDDTELVRRRVQDLTRLAEMRWRYRVVDKGAACRSKGPEP